MFIFLCVCVAYFRTTHDFSIWKYWYFWYRIFILKFQCNIHIGIFCCFCWNEDKCIEMYVTVLALSANTLKKNWKAVCKKKCLNSHSLYFHCQQCCRGFFVGSGFPGVGYLQDLCKNCHRINWCTWGISM